MSATWPNEVSTVCRYVAKAPWNASSAPRFSAWSAPPWKIGAVSPAMMYHAVPPAVKSVLVFKASCASEAEA